MLKIMLCGASDTQIILDSFIEVVHEVQGEPYNYLINKINYWNGHNSSWIDNARSTVKDMDLCVFLLLEKVGDITWDAELDEACKKGKPFIILCSSDVYEKVRQGKQKKRLAKQHHLIKHLDELQLTLVPFNADDFKEKLRNELFNIIYKIFSESLSKISFAELFLLPSIAFGVLNYLYSTDNPEQYARFVVAKNYGAVRKTIAAYGGGNILRDGQEEKDFGVIGIMNEKKKVVFYDFVNRKLHILENDNVIDGNTDRDPGKSGGRRAMLAAPIWSNQTIAGALTFDFFREPPKDLQERDIINRINHDGRILEMLMRNSCRYAEKIKELLFS